MNISNLLKSSLDSHLQSFDVTLLETRRCKTVRSFLAANG